MFSSILCIPLSPLVLKTENKQNNDEVKWREATEKEGKWKKIYSPVCYREQKKITIPFKKEISENEHASYKALSGRLSFESLSTISEMMNTN